MACACKSNNGAKKQVSQITKRTVSSSSQIVRKVNNNPERKQIIIKRPAR